MASPTSADLRGGMAMGKPEGGPAFRGREGVNSSPEPRDSTSSSQDQPTLAGSTPRNASSERVHEPANEQSPLLSASGLDQGGEQDTLIDGQTVLDEQDEYQTTRSAWWLILLTISIGGLQIAWAVELSNGSPYLLSLGLSKSLMALVWIAGPLSGSLVQPYVGIRSDNCRISWGKRKPFMIGGSIGTIFSLLALAWVREFGRGFLGIFGGDAESEGVKTFIIVVAVILVYILDFAINTVQAAIRAFIVDCAPTHQQEAANAMASRVVGIGNIVGYVFGYVNLPKYFWFFGNTQFKVLSVIASIALATTVAISCVFIRERDPRLEGEPSRDKGGVVSFFRGVFSSIKRLPPQTRKVCEVQFFAWIGWFPFLFYLSTWIGELYVQQFFIDHPNLTPEEIDNQYERATRVGTFALLIWAILSLLSNLLLPFFIAPTYDAPASSAISIRSVASNKSYTTRLDRLLETLIIPWLTLRRAWMVSLIIFAIAMFSALVITSATVATVVVGIIGIPWAVTLWAPFAIISAEISKRDALRRSQQSAREIIDPGDDNGDQAGVILGIHNMSIAAPQVIATLGSSIIFRWLQKPRGTPGDRSMSVVFAAGGVFGAIGAFLASRLSEEKEEKSIVRSSDGNTPRTPRSRRSLSRSGSFGGTLEY